MEVPFFDLRRVYQSQKKEIHSAVIGVLESGWYILGNAVKSFEEKMAKSIASGNAGSFIACNSGTDAIVLSLIASGIDKEHEVVTVSHTAPPTITAICATGAKPVFVDVDPETWVMDVPGIQKSISPKTKAVVAVHLYGNMVDIPAIERLLKKMDREDIVIIEDVAQAQGAKLFEKEAGTLGRFGTFSFYPTKNLGALGDGGGVFTTQKEDIIRLQMLRNYGQRDRYNAEMGRGLNSRLDEIQATILETRLSKVKDWNNLKNKMMKTYHEELSRLPLLFQKITEGCAPAWHLAVVAIENKEVRDRLKEHLAKQGIQTIIHYPIPNHFQGAFKEFSSSKLKITETLADSILSIPMNMVLTESEQAYVIKSVKAFFH